MKKTKNIILLGLCGLSLVIALFCVSHELIGYAILAFTITVLFGLFGGSAFIGNHNPDAVFESEIKGLLNTYDSILLKCSSVPNMDGRNIIKVESMDDLVDAQYEIRKPICYLKQSESCAFMLLDEKEAYVFIKKINDEVLSPVEIEINNMKFRKRENSDMDSEMLQDIDKTTIIKLSNKKSYKVSPIRKKNEEKKESLNKTEYEAEYLFDATQELPEVAIKNDDIEILDL